MNRLLQTSSLELRKMSLVRQNQKQSSIKKAINNYYLKNKLQNFKNNLLYSHRNSRLNSSLSLFDLGFLGRVGGGVFSPNQISNLYIWYDASDITTITKDGTNRVSQWNNKEGTAARNLVQATGGNQPLWVSAGQNGKDVIDTVGNRFMKPSAELAAISQPWTLYVTAKIPLDDGTNHLLGDGWDGTNRGQLFSNNTVADQYYGDNGVTGWTFLDAAIDNTWKLITLIWDGASSSVKIADVQKQTFNFGTTTFEGLNLGSTPDGSAQWWNSPIGEWIWYTKALSSSENSSVVNYLNSKWGL